MFGRAYQDGSDNEELRGFKEMGMIEKWMLGFKFEITSAFYFFERELYKSAIVETIMFFCILVPYILIQILAAVFFGLGGIKYYFSIIGGVLELIAMFLLFVLLCLIPLLADMYNRVSEKTEKMLDGEQVDPSSTPRCSGQCLLFVIVYVITGFIEFLIFFPIALICVICLIIPPLGIFMLYCFSSFTRSYGSFKVVFLRHGLDYFGLLKFFLNPEVFPFYMGLGTGYICMRRVMRQFPGGGLLAHIVTVVSATRFYHFYVLNNGEFPPTQRGGNNAAFMAQPPADQQVHAQPSDFAGVGSDGSGQIVQPTDMIQEPTVTYADQTQEDNIKTDSLI